MGCISFTKATNFLKTFNSSIGHKNQIVTDRWEFSPGYNIHLEAKKVCSLKFSRRYANLRAWNKMKVLDDSETRQMLNFLLHQLSIICLAVQIYIASILSSLHYYTNIPRLNL